MVLDRSMFWVHKTSRKRDPDEVKALTEVAKASLQRTECEGKFVKLEPRSFYYDPSSWAETKVWLIIQNGTTWKDDLLCRSFNGVLILYNGFNAQLIDKIVCFYFIFSSATLKIGS